MRAIDEQFFFDSYAIIELIRGNPNFQIYSDSRVITTKLNLFEVCCNLIKSFDEPRINLFMKKYSKLLADFDLDVVKQAAILKIKKSRDNLSLVDCIGYVISLKSGIKFLTGDEKFRNLPNVEFVK